jgi:flagellar assembly protein FliH
MTSHFQKFEYRELTAPTEKVAADTNKYQEPVFSIEPDTEGATQTLRKSEHFQLDQAVASQLGVNERERQAAETRIQKEIERRWEAATEKAEVAGFTRGLDEGKAEAYRAELPRIREKVERIDAILQEFNSFREKIFSANEAFLMDLISQVAGMVALKEVTSDPDYVRRLVTALLQQVGTKEDLKIYLSAKDHSNAESLFAALQKEFGKLSNTTIESCDDIPTGGCRIETRFGVVDASVATQIENAIRSVKA